MLLCVDHPVGGAPCDPLCIRVEGWAAPAPPGVDSTVEFLLNGVGIGTSNERFVREDVNRTLAWPATSRCGFALVGHSPNGPFGTDGVLTVRILHGAHVVATLDRSVRLIATDHRREPFGILLRSDFVALNHREQFYTSGPSHSDGSPEFLELILRFLGPTPRRILDIGCGLGWYGKELLQKGHAWHGAEMKAQDCAALERAGLPHTAVNGATLPFAAAAFDAAIAVEVLEHVRDLGAFLAEAARVAPEGLMISVPNAELVSYLSVHRAAPWHMLEADHCNFFTRASLGALLQSYYRQVEVGVYSEHPLKTSEGAPLHYHLYAVARHAR